MGTHSKWAPAILLLAVASVAAVWVAGKLAIQNAIPAGGLAVEVQTDVSMTRHEPLLSEASEQERLATDVVRVDADDAAARRGSAVDAKLLNRKGLDVLADEVARGRQNLEKRRNVASAYYLVKQATYLREDLLGRSYSLDGPLPRDASKRDSWIAVSGYNGRRFYQFTEREYPLYWEFSSMSSEGPEAGAAALPEHLLREVLDFADESLRMFHGAGK